MTSGLFDTGFTDLSADRSVNSKMSTEELDSVSEMLSSIGGTDDLLDDLPSSLELDASFNEVFTDLSAFIEQDQTLMGTDLTSVAPMVEDSTVPDKPTKRGSKRKSPALNPQLTDHSNYATKRPKVELPAIDSQEVTSTATSPSAKEKYRARRDKNNAASKKSREIRKQKFNNMEGKAQELEKENATLREKVAELEKLTKQMKDMLVQRLAQS